MRICTARASGISRETVKSRCAREWGGWGRISEDGPGQQNPDRSEGPWGRAVNPLARRCSQAHRPGHRAGSIGGSREYEGRWQTSCAGKAASDIPALKPYRGKPAVRNFRGGNGNTGIIETRSAPLPYPTTRSAKCFLGSWSASRSRSLCCRRS